MIEDPIVAEVRAARDAYARQFNYDLKAIVRDLRERQQAEGRKVVRLPPKPVKRRPATVGEL
jgi:hypothetical protein